MAKGQCRQCGKGCNSTRSWGYRCAECIREYRRKWAKDGRKRGLSVSGEASPEWWAEYLKSYYANPKNRRRRARRMREYRRDPKLRMKHEARWQANHALRSGRIKKMPCIKCGSIKSEMHHPDYFKPLEVIWLCRTCHRAEHARAEGRQ